ncbi:hypothetical protein HZU40_00425 (plasmid) [Mycolicibacterium fluoranthenivorans]|uniref:Uncharacterized protein n=1 Tax=Mycolicibacterium fluoranthenivorans TaxID=258505 RepID=A0A7G8P6J3_9MYCO|nr:hypothetical protein [Mycolicibacterium fluoranthenivorans]QNJ89959.1 hypothetical protein HZU40_00425 [Mycolicibacterium fluoranthenivorans]
MATFGSSAFAPRRVMAAWRRIPRRAQLGLAVAALAVAALAWQHHSATATPHDVAPPAAAAAAPAPGSAPDLGDAPTVGQLAPPTIGPSDPAAQDAARATVQRFATNFATPNGNRDDWLARITGDVSAQLAEQYRLTDIRNVTQADVTSVDGPVHQEPGTITFDVDYSDGTRIEIRLEASTDGWNVINVLPLTSLGVRPALDRKYATRGTPGFSNEGERSQLRTWCDRLIVSCGGVVSDVWQGRSHVVR